MASSPGLSVFNISTHHRLQGKNVGSVRLECCSTAAVSSGVNPQSLAVGRRIWPRHDALRVAGSRCQPPSAGWYNNNSSNNSNKQQRSWRVEAAVKKTYTSFDDVVKNSPVPVLVDFYALWCGPCQLMSQTVLPEVSRRLKGRLQVVKIDTEKYPRLASEHEIQALPTLMLFDRGKLLYRFEGALPADQLVSQIDVLLSSAK